MARKSWKWEYHLPQVLLTKPAQVVQEACQVLEKHGCSVKKELKSELYLSSYTLPSCVPSTALCRLDIGTCTNCMGCFNVRTSPPFVEGYIPNCVMSLALMHMLMQYSYSGDHM